MTCVRPASLSISFTPGTVIRLCFILLILEVEVGIIFLNGVVQICYMWLYIRTEFKVG